MAADKELQDKIQELRLSGETYDKIGVMIGISGAMVWKINMGKCSSQAARVHFGLSVEPVPIAPCICGEVHVKKSCPKQGQRRPRYRLNLEFETKFQRDEMLDMMDELGGNRKSQSEILSSIFYASSAMSNFRSF